MAVWSHGVDGTKPYEPVISPDAGLPATTDETAASTRLPAANAVVGAPGKYGTSCRGPDRAVSSRHGGLHTIGPRGGGAGAPGPLAPAEVPCGPHSPPTAMCGA